jgi:hypothetical protein
LRSRRAQLFTRRRLTDITAAVKISVVIPVFNERQTIA